MWFENFLKVAIVSLLPLFIAQGAFGQKACLQAQSPQILPGKEAALEKRSNLAGQLRSLLNEYNVISILNNQDLPVFGQRLEKIMDAIKSNPGINDRLILYKEIYGFLRADGVPDSLIAKGLKEARPDDLASIYRMLGNLTFQEVRGIYMGSAKGIEPTPDSLVGRFIQETGAATKVMKIVARDKSKVFDQDKLVVAVSAESFEKFKAMFSKKTWMSVLAHASVLHKGGVISHGGGAPRPMQMLAPGAPLPMLIMKTSEAERFDRYMTLASSEKYRSWNHALKHPWDLPGYVERGIWQCCTHWLGNVPIGDKLVDAYHLPKRNQNPTAAERPNINYQTLGPGSPLKAWVPTAQTEDLKQVWTVPGHEQLSSVVGRLDNNVANEFASPGWVIQSLMGPTTNERVPVIFMFAADHKAPIPDEPAWQFETPY